MESHTSHSPRPTLEPTDARSHTRAATRSSAKSLAGGQGIVGPALLSVLGNDTIGRMLASGPSSFAPSVLGSMGIQAKLHVSAADDPQEQEADRVADEVMRMPETVTSLQRASADHDSDTAQRSAFDAFVQRRPAPSQHRGGFTADASIAARIQAARGSGSALDGASRAFLEPRFGVDFSPVRIHAGSEAAQLSRSIRAHAFTIGSDIFFGEGEYQPQSDTGRRLLSHELTHVVQQTGAQLQRAVLTPGTIFRYSLEGPFHKGDPVHEVLTLLTLGEADKILNEKKISKRTLLRNLDVKKLPGWDSFKWHNYDPTETPKAAQEFIRGVVWPDDPRCLLFDNARGTEDYSSGAMWFEEFDADETKDPKALTARSHFGDLQFLHAMATGAGELAAFTRSKIISWATFLVRVALGRYSAKQSLQSIVEVRALFDGFPDYTVRDLFAGNPRAATALTNLDVKQRALGALLHVIQDSCAGGHTERSPQGPIRQFHDYGGQDHDKHGEFDKWGTGKQLKDHVNNTPGAQQAIDFGKQVVVLLEMGNEARVLQFLRTKVFALSRDALPAGAGAEFAPKK